MYKITFNFVSPICFIDQPVFDSIIAYALIKEKQGSVIQKLNLDQIDDFSELPIKKHKDGYFISSVMFFNENINSTGSWKKRWANKYDFIADFGKSKRKINITRSEFKSYDVPINLYSIKQGWFYFDSDNIDRVKELIDKYIVGIGKKISQGYGFFDSYTIESSNVNFDKILMRPIPANKTDLPGIIKYTGWKPPYWLPANMDLCKCPSMMNA